MTVEAVSFINDLNTALPDENNKRLEGDDHIRNIKTALKNTFPGMAGRYSRVVPRAATFNAVQNDANTIITCSAALTVNLPAVATVGNGWSVWIESSGGTVTLDPSGVELVNGAATLALPQGRLARVVCDGTKYLVHILDKIGGFEAGTRVIFQQTAAPLGWTKETSSGYNDAALRLVIGDATFHQGNYLFSGVFSADGVRSTGGHALTVNQMPPHTHTQTFSQSTGTIQGGSAIGDTLGSQTGSTGGGAVHSHTLTGFDIAHADVIIGIKSS